LNYKVFLVFLKDFLQFIGLILRQSLNVAKDKKRTLVVNKETETVANFFIKNFSQTKNEVQTENEVFYLNSPNKIFRNAHLQIQSTESRASAIETEVEVEIINSDPFTKFISKAKNPTIIIDWSAFTNKQILALNTILDKKPKFNSVNIPDNTTIISLVKDIPHDTSFSSRHQSCITSSADFGIANISNIADISNNVPTSKEYKTDNDNTDEQNQSQKIIDPEAAIGWRQKLFGFIKSYTISSAGFGSDSGIANISNKAPTSKEYKTDDDTVDEQNQSQKIIDLEGLPDWKQKLFGAIKLDGKNITWNKSDFSKQLEAGVSNFKIINLTKKAQKILKRDIEEAKASGTINYHGYLIKLPSNIKIDFEKKAFDFTKFNKTNNPELEQFAESKNFKIRTKNNVSHSSPELPNDIMLVNTKLFDQLLKRNSIDDNKNYHEVDGFIKEHQGQKLNLFITSSLSTEQSYSLLNEALKYNVALDLYLAPNITILSEINCDAITDENNNEPKIDSKKPQVIATNNPNELVEEILQDTSIYAVIDVEDYNYQQLFAETKYEKTADGYENFEEIFSEFYKKLAEGKKIILKGKFPNDLLLILHPILCSSDPKYSKIQDNLILIIEDSGITQNQSKYAPLEFLGDNGYLVKSYDLSNQKLAQSPFDFFEDTKEDSQNLDLEDSGTESKEFIEARKSKLNEMIQENPMVQMVGHSGVGKSQLMNELAKNDPDCEIYMGLPNIEDWANNNGGKKKILFIDESNIEDSHLTRFSPLKIFHDEQGNKKVRMLIDNEFCDLDKNHKVVFARNPHNYSSGRIIQKLFCDNKIPVMYLRDFTSPYIYEEILKKPIYDKCSDLVKSVIGEERFKNKCIELIGEYQEFNKKIRAKKDYNETDCETVRELQENLLLYIKDELSINHNELRDELTYKESKSETFISTAATEEVEKSLMDAIDIKKLKRKGHLGEVSAGLNGLIIEGDSGIGKTELIRAVFATKGIVDGSLDLEADESNPDQKYYKIDAATPPNKIKECIITAFENGDIIWIDELNSIINQEGLEKILNAALTGDHPIGKKDVTIKPGFMMVSSVNSYFLADSDGKAVDSGRDRISPAIKHRSTMLQAKSLREYEQKDLQKIAGHNVEIFLTKSGEPNDKNLIKYTSVIAETVAQTFKESIDGKSSILNLRDLNDVVAGVVEEARSVVNLQALDLRDMMLKFSGENDRYKKTCLATDIIQKLAINYTECEWSKDIKSEGKNPHDSEEILTPLFDSLFQSKIIINSTTDILNTDSKSKNSDKCSIIRLPITDNSEKSTNSLITKYQSVEQLEIEERLKEINNQNEINGKGVKDFEQTRSTEIEIPSTTDEFVVQFKRFNHNHLGLQKDSSDILLSEIKISDRKFTPTAFVVHSGDDKGGHYVAYIRKEDGWYKYDDLKSSAERVEDNNSIEAAQKQAYYVKYSDSEKVESLLPKNIRNSVPDNNGNRCYLNAALIFACSFESSLNMIQENLLGSDEERKTDSIVSKIKITDTAEFTLGLNDKKSGAINPTEQQHNNTISQARESFTFEYCDKKYQCESLDGNESFDIKEFNGETTLVDIDDDLKNDLRKALLKHPDLAHKTSQAFSGQGRVLTTNPAAKPKQANANKLDGQNQVFIG